MISFAEIDKVHQGEYIKLLTLVSKLSSLFSDSDVPFINYRVAENIFCRSFNADNLSRSDTAFDAKYIFNKISYGVGLKTFICNSNNSLEKISEFNSYSHELKALKGEELANRLSELRNLRIMAAKSRYNVAKSIYHVVARRKKKIILFETDYDLIETKNIEVIHSDSKTLKFNDRLNEYSFNFSKSTLYRKFTIPENYYSFEVQILDDPFSVLYELGKINPNKLLTNRLIEGVDYVILPLYSYDRAKQKFVFEKSGLNQWNAGGRKRDYGELYIPIPQVIHSTFPNFFPNKEIAFKLRVPGDDTPLNAKLCQENSKALMTNPNKSLSEWLLRSVLLLKEGELATIERLDMLGFDSVIITKNNELDYSIDVCKTDSYENFSRLFLKR